MNNFNWYSRYICINWTIFCSQLKLWVSRLSLLLCVQNMYIFWNITFFMRTTQTHTFTILWWQLNEHKLINWITCFNSIRRSKFLKNIWAFRRDTSATANWNIAKSIDQKHKKKLREWQSIAAIIWIVCITFQLAICFGHLKV